MSLWSALSWLDVRKQQADALQTSQNHCSISGDGASRRVETQKGSSAVQRSQCGSSGVDSQAD
jgi:hypothetical protein